MSFKFSVWKNNISSMSRREKLKLVFAVCNIFLWFVALTSMTAFTVRDIVELCNQYYDGKPVATVSTKDNSSSGIHLPNTTVCMLIEHEKQDVILKNFTFDFDNFTKSDLPNVMDYVVTSRLFDYETTQVAKEYQNFSQLEQTYPTVVQNMYHDQNFWNRLSKQLCEILNVKFYINDVTVQRKYIIDNVCKAAEQGMIPFTINAKTVICFRIPLDLVNINDSNLAGEDAEVGQESITIGNSKSVILEFQPLALRQYFPSFDQELRLWVIAPENPMSYSGAYTTGKSRKPQFSHQLVYPKDFDYMMMKEVDIDVTVSAVYKYIDGSSECTNVHNKTTCIVKCMEKDFVNVCGCNRFLFRHFITDPDHDYCNITDYRKCYDEYKNNVWINRRPNDTSDLQKCIKDCDKCTNIDYLFRVQETAVFYKQYPGDVNKTCKAYKHYLEDKKINCDKFLNNITGYLPGILTGKYEYANDLTTRHNSYNPLFGQVSYQFSIKSYEYPEFVQRYSITDEDFKSQIGGIMGLYLGISGLTFFAIAVKLIKTSKKYVFKKEEKKIVRSKVIDKLWTMFAVNQMMEETRKVSKLDLVSKDRRASSYVVDKVPDQKSVEDLTAQVKHLEKELSKLQSQFDVYGTSHNDEGELVCKL